MIRINSEQKKYITLVTVIVGGLFGYSSERVNSKVNKEFEESSNSVSNEFKVKLTVNFTGDSLEITNLKTIEIPKYV
jgi:hypothetical protein